MSTFHHASLRDAYNTLMAHIANQVRYSLPVPPEAHDIAARLRALLRLVAPPAAPTEPQRDPLGQELPPAPRPRYVPGHFCDEVGPPTRRHPNDWIRVRNRNEQWLVADEDDAAAKQGDEALWPGEYGPLADGMIIQFAALTTYPDAVLEVWQDADDTLAHRWISAPHPDAATLHFAGDWETTSDAAYFLDDARKNRTLEPGTHTVCALTWSDADFVFEAATNTFRPLTAEEAVRA